MLELNASSFYHVCTRLDNLNGYIEAHKDSQSAQISEENRKSLTEEFLTVLIEHLSILSANVTIMAVHEAIELLQEDLSWNDLLHPIEDINNTLTRELTLTRVYVLEVYKQRYYAPEKSLFGKDFEDKFVSSAFELDEAAKCLALSRPTACVFHLMRLMEIAVRAVARCLAIPDPIQPAERSWGAVLKKIRDGIDAKWPTVAARSVGDGEVFDSLYASLDAVKNPWRNSTMHPANKYTDDEAEHIFTAVRGFIMRLASRCDENGDPKA